MIGRSKASGGRAMGFLGFVALADLLFALSAGLLLLNTTAAPAAPHPLPPPTLTDDARAADEDRRRAAWEEEQVTFGPGSAADACGKDGLAARMRQAGRPAPGLEQPSRATPSIIISHAGIELRQGGSR